MVKLNVVLGIYAGCISSDGTIEVSVCGTFLGTVARDGTVRVGTAATDLGALADIVGALRVAAVQS